MKAGPALRQLGSHRAIHEGAQDEAKALTADMIQLYHGGEEKDALTTARMLIKHWEEKIIAHADTEDEGLFPDLLQEDHVDKKGVHMMMRDHDLFRKIVNSIKEKLEKENKVTQEIIYECTTLIIINSFHHQGEEKYIFHERS